MTSPTIEILRQHVHKGEAASVENLLSLVQFSQEVGYEMMCLAAQHGHPDVIRALIKYNYPVNCPPNFNFRGPAPLHYASINNHMEIVHLLLDKGADVNAQF